MHDFCLCSSWGGGGGGGGGDGGGCCGGGCCDGSNVKLQVQHRMEVSGLQRPVPGDTQTGANNIRPNSYVLQDLPSSRHQCYIVRTQTGQVTLPVLTLLSLVSGGHGAEVGVPGRRQGHVWGSPEMGRKVN